MKLTKFEIKFDNRQGVFEAGGAVSGQVFLHLAKPMKMRNLKIFFIGESKSWWDERHGKNNTTKYRAKEFYINQFMQLFPSEGSSTRDGQIEHPAGQHVYPFLLALPNNIPSSFEGVRGYIRYSCKATIDRPWKFDSHIKHLFTVIKHLDLNMEPSAVIPIFARDSQEIEGCCCNEGSIDVELEINKGGYVPGEPINYDISINNKSSHTVRQITFDLSQVVNYTGYSDSMFSSGRPHLHPKQETFNLMSDGSINIPPNTTSKVRKYSLVPSLPPSRLEGCNIIDIEYIAKMKVKCGGADVKIKRNILIGTKPTREAVPVAMVQPVMPSAPTLNPVPDVMSPPAYDEVVAPPPSYSECVFGRTQVRDENDDEHTDGDVTWAPAYPYYDWTVHSGQTFGDGPPTEARYNPNSYDD